MSCSVLVHYTWNRLLSASSKDTGVKFLTKQLTLTGGSRTALNEGWIHLQHTRIAVTFLRWNFFNFCFFILSLKTIKNPSGQMRQLYVYVANESTRRLDTDRMSTGLTNTHTTREFSVLYDVFARKHCTLCSALRHKSYLSLQS